MSMSLPRGCSLFPGFTVHKYCKCLRRAECGVFVYLCRWAQRSFPRNIYLCDSYLQLRLHPISGQNNTRHCHMMPPCLQSWHLSDYCFHFIALDKQWLSLLFLSFCLNPVFLSTFTVLLCLPSISTACIVPTSHHKQFLCHAPLRSEILSSEGCPLHTCQGFPDA